MPPLPPQTSSDADVECPYGNPTDYPIPPLPSQPPTVSEASSSTTAQAATMSPVVTKQPIPSVQTIESQSAWRNIGATQLSASLGKFLMRLRLDIWQTRESLLGSRLPVKNSC